MMQAIKGIGAVILRCITIFFSLVLIAMLLVDGALDKRRRRKWAKQRANGTKN
jgi:hypothetical protein